MGNLIFEQALEKGSRCERLTRAEAYRLADAITPDRLHRLGAAALENRQRRFGRRATYVFNLQINPSNICGSGCTFCNYAASKNAPHAYVLEEPEIFEKVQRLGPTEAHIVGGLNQIWNYRRNLELVRSLRSRFAGLHIKAYTAVEIDYFAQTAGLSTSTVLDQLKEAGMDAMPGGGAEIFSDRLYRQHWKNKTSPEGWVRIHQLAHGKGIPTNATMLFGFGDTWDERIEHLLILRRAQDVSGGFACFIPLPFQPGSGHFIEDGPTPLETLAVLAISRLVLDNIPHLKSYWPMTGLETGAAGLSWGADDMDGTISEERIAHLAGAATPVGLARNKMVDTISTAGFVPVERDGLFSPKGEGQ
ncbi:aminodeoxyfutalosine synthase [Desulfosarcina alkanivorans]|uniref:Aminodeoxyfutalosine synthase n=1 Tax=Desulfosarcina alkanivorans TaxID=571177 RepID=A0A5K7YJN9_9BACT|nr:CofH family radical SAM protein [Desulfosarcina alkanivorans]BBO66574.1 aminodeoxyfutalosine synthase [Desulfosarcina alkanivorans]